MPVVMPEGTAQAQQAGTDKMQQASTHEAHQQPVRTKASPSQHGDSEPPIHKTVHMNGQALPSLPGAQANGPAADVSAAQGSGLSKEPHAAPQAATTRDEQLQAAALEGTAAASQTAVNAGLSLPTPRSGTERHQLSLEVWHGCMFMPLGIFALKSMQHVPTASVLWIISGDAGKE